MAKTARVLIVDDEEIIRVVLRELLAKDFDVVTATSGEEALALCKDIQPDLVVLDIMMPGLDGYETCRRLRQAYNIPVIFATSAESLEEHLKAFDAGGNDLIVKPVVADLLRRKVHVAISQHQMALQLSEEKAELQKLAAGFLASLGQSGALVKFMRSNAGVRTYHELALLLQEATCELGVSCSILIRHDGGPTILTPAGDPTPIEQSILEQVSGMGRLFQFSNRLAVNYPRVTIVVADMPSESVDPSHAGRIRDSVAILAETTAFLVENIDVRMESAKRAEHMQVAHTSAVESIESLREKYAMMLGDTRILIQEMVSKVERGFTWLGASESQERRLTDELDASVQRILGKLAEGGDFETHFEKVIASLRSGDRKPGAVELF